MQPGYLEGPWCAVENIGQDVRYDCIMRTLEQCVSLIIAGNRGFCNPNPYYRGPEATPSRSSASDSIIAIVDADTAWHAPLSA
jgi:hypothetical protein